MEYQDFEQDEWLQMGFQEISGSMVCSDSGLKTVEQIFDLGRD